MTDSERQKAKRLRRKPDLSPEEKAWLEKYEKGIETGAKSMKEVGAGSPSNADPQPASSGGSGALPPLNVSLPGEVASPVKGGKPASPVTTTVQKKVAPRDPETGHVIATPLGTTAGQLLEKYIGDQNKWLRENGGSPYPEALIPISCFSMQQCVDYYLSPIMSGEMALHALNAVTPIAWTWWFKRKRESGLDTRMQEAESALASKPAEKKIPEKTSEPKREEPKETSNVLPQTQKEIQDAVSAISGGRNGSGGLT